MALAKKGSRLLTVEQVRYRWIVAPGDEPGLGIVVEDADSPGSLAPIESPRHESAA